MTTKVEDHNDRLEGGSIVGGEGLTLVGSFDDMNLKQELLRGIYATGFEAPSPIQQRAILPSIKGLDIICQSQSGTGKTATFSISLLQRIDESLKASQALVLSPTRDLARQTFEVIAQLSSYTPITLHCCVGGTNVREDARALEAGPQVVVATPGRCLDSIQRGHLDPSQVRLLVLDEMDVLLSSGFKEPIYEIFQQLPEAVQVMLVSATMPQEALEISGKFMRDPVKIMVKKEAITLSGIKQFFVYLEKEDQKLDTLLDVYEAISVSQSVIFVNTIRKAEWLADTLDRRQYTVGMIHSGFSTAERVEIIKKFRQGDTKVLIATDILARGIDAQGVKAVVNYDLPRDKENYIHRVGRCGRFGKKGFALNLITSQDVPQMREIEAFYDTVIPELPADFEAQVN